MRKHPGASTILIPAGILLLVGGMVYHGMRVDPLPAGRIPMAPVWELSGRGLKLAYPGGALVSDLAVFGDELFSYMMFQYMAHLPRAAKMEVMLTYDGGRYVVRGRLPEDVVEGIGVLAEAQAAGLARRFEWRVVPLWEVRQWRQQSRVFVGAYHLPAKQKLEQIPPARLHAYLERYIRFKSATDPRVRSGEEWAPKVLTKERAARLAGDIITVAGFYSLPIDFFAGIGAMENNYMNVRGDLGHSVWKRRAAKDDIVLQRRRGKVRVLNESQGVWQITVETLRHAHRLYLKDDRDYSLLPEHLRPPKTLDVKEVDPAVLTTYAGLLFRELLDKFDGNVRLAVGAYNGGPGNPNLVYERGVRAVAEQARRLLEQAAVLNGESVLQMDWILAR
ncbi:MAG: lytic transglycosylase domain-containing protein [Bryobacterales bacterium]|nr:lytic transglycosylase domain-containing protein [Bryobacterales bacterium]